MKITSRITICLAAALMCLGAASCKKDTTIQYANMTMGNVEGSTFVSDQGNVFNIVEHEDNSYDELMKAGRAYILCDVLSKTAGGQDNEYDVRLRKPVVKVLTKDIVTLGTEASEEMLKEDPIDMRYCWFSGGYINFYIEFPTKEGSNTSHMINLIQKESEKGYLFRLTHNAYGDTIENSANGRIVRAGGYVSFPISTLIKEDKAEVMVEWRWHKTAGEIISMETEVMGIKGTYTKDGFEHPTKGAATTMAVMN